MEKVSKTVVSDGIMEPRDVNAREPGCEREFFSSIQLSENLYYNVPQIHAGRDLTDELPTKNCFLNY